MSDVAPSVSGTGLAVVVGSSFGDAGALDGPDARIFERHGTARATPAHLLDHHATITAICEAGCDRVLALGSVGSLRADLAVGSFICPDDFYAPGVNPTFFDDMRGHMVPGFDPEWRKRVIAAWRDAGGEIADAGVYAQTPGPRFETPAEVRALAAHADIVGMTIASEAILAAEAGLAYAVVCVADNLANGLEGRELTLEELNRARAVTTEELAARLPAVIAELAG